jgi:hypothetical protein
MDVEALYPRIENQRKWLTARAQECSLNFPFVENHDRDWR